MFGSSGLGAWGIDVGAGDFRTSPVAGFFFFFGGGLFRIISSFKYQQAYDLGYY